MFAVAGDEGIVQIYDLGAKCIRPAAELKLPGESRRVLSVQFNPKVRDIIACGDSIGHVHVWQLSWGLSSAIPCERENLRRMVEER